MASNARDVSTDHTLFVTAHGDAIRMCGLLFVDNTGISRIIVGRTLGDMQYVVDEIDV